MRAVYFVTLLSLAACGTSATLPDAGPDLCIDVPACGCRVSDPACSAPSYPCAVAGYLGGGCPDSQWCSACLSGAACETECLPRALEGEPCPGVDVACATGLVCSAGDTCLMPDAECDGGCPSPTACIVGACFDHGCITVVATDGTPCGDGATCENAECHPQ